MQRINHCTVQMTGMQRMNRCTMQMTGMQMMNRCTTAYGKRLHRFPCTRRNLPVSCPEICGERCAAVTGNIGILRSHGIRTHRFHYRGCSVWRVCGRLRGVPIVYLHLTAGRDRFCNGVHLSGHDNGLCCRRRFRICG